MHQVVAGSGWNTIDLALLSSGINEKYIKVSVPLEHSSIKALNTTSDSWKILPRTYATHTEIVAANELIIIVQHPRATGTVAGQPHPLPSANTCDALYSNEHYSTCGTQHPLTTSNSCARTSVRRAPTPLPHSSRRVLLLLFLWSNALAHDRRFL